MYVLYIIMYASDILLSIHIYL